MNKADASESTSAHKWMFHPFIASIEEVGYSWLPVGFELGGLLKLKDFMGASGGACSALLALSDPDQSSRSGFVLKFSAM